MVALGRQHSSGGDTATVDEVDEDNNDNGTRTIGWQQRKWNNNNLMVMGS
jgi:hypothetical protein